MGPSSTFYKKYWYIFWPYHGKYRNLATYSWTSWVGVTGENVFIFHNYLAIMQSFNFLSGRNARSSIYICKLSIWVVELFFSQPWIIPSVSKFSQFLHIFYEKWRHLTENKWKQHKKCYWGPCIPYMIINLHNFVFKKILLLYGPQ